MSKSKSLLTKTNVKRACEGAEMAGKRIARVEIDTTGKIILVIDNNGNAEAENREEIRL